MPKAMGAPSPSLKDLNLGIPTLSNLQDRYCYRFACLQTRYVESRLQAWRTWTYATLIHLGIFDMAARTALHSSKISQLSKLTFMMDC